MGGERGVLLEAIGQQKGGFQNETNNNQKVSKDVKNKRQQIHLLILH